MTCLFIRLLSRTLALIEKLGDVAKICMLTVDNVKDFTNGVMPCTFDADHGVTEFTQTKNVQTIECPVNGLPFDPRKEAFDDILTQEFFLNGLLFHCLSFV